MVLAPAQEYLKFEHQVGRPLPHLVLTETGLIHLESAIDELFNDLSGLHDYLGFVFVRTDVGEIEVFIMPDEAIAPGKTKQHTITDEQIDSELRLKKVRKRFSCLKKGSFVTLAPFVESENCGAPLADPLDLFHSRLDRCRSRIGRVGRESAEGALPLEPGRDAEEIGTKIQGRFNSLFRRAPA